MKLITWNSNCSFRTKFNQILKNKPDILIIPESENVETFKKYQNEMNFNTHIWDGAVSYKGLSVFTFNDYYAEIAPFYNPDFKYIIPIYIKNKDKTFLLLAVWSKLAKNKTLSYITQVCLALEEYKEYIDKNTIIAGDFNSNKQWDNLFNRKYNHSYLLNLLNNLDFISVYHNFYNQKQGEETAPTHYYHRNKEKSFHIDFMFIHKDRNIQSFSLGNFNDWISLSDHVPLFTEIM